MLTKSEERFLRTYEEPLQWPKQKFVLIYGLVWGAMTLLLITLFDLIFNFQQGLWKDFKSAVITIVCWALGGLVMGWWMHRILSYKHQKIMKKKES